MSSNEQPVRCQIEAKLTAALAPDHVQVENESGNHNVPPGSETHFKVVIVSSHFEGLSRVKRHQAVYAALAEELASGVHALALHTFAPAEWQQTPEVAASPDCLGGAGRQ